MTQQEKQNNRIILTKHQRIRIVAKAEKLSRKMQEQYTVLFTPDTVIRWYNKLIVQKYDVSKYRVIQENPRRRHQKIIDQIVYLSYKKSSGIKPIELSAISPNLNHKLRKRPIPKLFGIDPFNTNALF